MDTTIGANVRLSEGVAIYEKEVQNLCDFLKYDGIIHVTIDEKFIEAGKTQRKPELHVDGRFTGMSWAHPSPGWNHFCNELPLPRMAVAIASSLPKCRVYHGRFDAEPNHQGDLSHIRNQVGEGSLVPANEWHLLSPDCVHESMAFDSSAKRSFIRVAFEENIYN